MVEGMTESSHPSTLVEPFAPPGAPWRPVSPKLATVKRISATVTALVTAVPAAIAVWLWTPWPWLAWVASGLALLLLVWLLTRAGRVVAAMGYAERDGDLCVRGGLLMKSLEIVPMGRLQVVRVSSGPFLRAFGLSTVELVTASPTTSPTIPGLPTAEAVALRDRLIERSDAEGSGL